MPKSFNSEANPVSAALVSPNALYSALVEELDTVDFLLTLYDTKLGPR